MMRLIVFAVSISIALSHGFIESPASRQSIVCNETFPDSRLPSGASPYFYCVSDLETGAQMPESGLPSPVFPDNCAGFHPGVAKMGTTGTSVCGPPSAGGFIETDVLEKLVSPGPVQAKWMSGETVEITWNVQANHGGFYSYRLCPDGSDTEECFQKHVLKTPEGKEWIQIPYGPCCWYTKMTDYLVIPNDITCERCTLNWRWDAGYSDVPETVRESSVFSSCSDVQISASVSV